MSSNGEPRGRHRGLGGKRADLGGRFFRSSWEANWARYLNWMKERGEIRSWGYECETFTFEKIKRGSRFYTPDFKITNNDGSTFFQEVKGWMDQKSATKLRRMGKYFPHIKVVLIQRREYMSAHNQLRRIIPGWE